MQSKQSRFRMIDPCATLILTRPREASERFLEQLGDSLTQGVRVVFSPLLEIVPTGLEPDLAGLRGVIFTSSNAVRFAGPGDGMAAYCVGMSTCAAARAAGWDAQPMGATADEFVEAMMAEEPPSPLLHVGGVHRRGDVARRLSDAGMETAEIVVYDQRSLPLTQEAQDALAGEKPVIVPLFSPRTARQFASLVHASAPLHLVAISDAVLAEMRPISRASRHVVPEPDARSMATAVANLLRRVEADHSPK